MDSYSSSQVALCCVINDSQVATFASQSELQNAKRARGHSKRSHAWRRLHQWSCLVARRKLAKNCYVCRMESLSGG
ncbi:hypothetical protein TNCT_25761 [Trichonephila clavata]|uniref:Uncharacterized protein n=1 Tax=Trichonephila clavata TaxID=2740835 RepID=A0A8X6GVD2_TRICU|nr:hypothetical protein TNCT_25761 [Trichonephila clavata]